MTPDRIEKQILLHAPLSRVWQAIADSSQFGTWFGIRFDGPFVAGQKLGGTVVPTEMNAEVAAQQKEYEGLRFLVWVERIEPERHLSFRWHAHHLPEGADPETEPTTLVAFDLERQGDGVLLTMSESGFDRVPIEHRAKAFESNEDGWEIQTQLIEAYLAGTG